MKRTPPIERVEARCVYEDRGYLTPCRIFTGYCTPDGYGQVGEGRHRLLRTHRVTYEHYVGPIPEGLELDHLCRVPACCEVTHLEAVTSSENKLRGTGPDVTRARYAAITHCPYGHEYTPENTHVYLLPNGYPNRHCRECGRWRNRNRVRTGIADA